MATPDDQREFAVEVVKRLTRAGHQALWAGGCVRDMLMGQPPADYDVATDADPDRVIAIFPRTVPVGVSFGVVRVLNPKGPGDVEVATFRSDGAYVDGRRPQSVSFGSPREDAARRDFTINGMFLDPLSSEVFDYVGGREDLNSGVVRAIGDPSARFAEDKLRLIRAARFAARFGFAIEPRTETALRAMASEIRVVAAERIAQELRRMLVDPSRTAGMNLAKSLGLQDAILPELSPMAAQTLEPSESLWDQTMQVLHHLPPEPSFPLALAALLHNAGKVQPNNPADCQLSFPSPGVIAKRLVEDLCRRLKLANADRDRAAWLVEHHESLLSPKDLRPSQLKTVLATPGSDELLALHRAIALADGRDAGHIEYCEWYLHALPDGELSPPPLLNGHDLARMGLPPGPPFTRFLARVRVAQLDGVIKTKEEAISWLESEIAGERGASAP
jgi:poly(A) polymerase